METDPGKRIRERTFGFIGLGDMGAPMAANLAGAALNLTVYDKAGTQDRAPPGADAAQSVAHIARHADFVFLSVPDGAVSLDIAKTFTELGDIRARALINLSTTGIKAAETAEELLAEAGIGYVDAPVSGGRSGAVSGAITIMWSGPEPLLGELRPVFQTFAGTVFFVGPNPGQGQALKLLNNFLSAVAMAATSEAVAFGAGRGLDMKTMLDVLNVSTGRNSATADKFPSRILTGSYDAGFRMALMRKDVALYLDEVRACGTADRLAGIVADYWRDGAETFPDGDFTEIFKAIVGNTFRRGHEIDDHDDDTAPARPASE